jgi:hypothetical protein
MKQNIALSIEKDFCKKKILSQLEKINHIRFVGSLK